MFSEALLLWSMVDVIMVVCIGALIHQPVQVHNDTILMDKTYKLWALLTVHKTKNFSPE